MLSYFHSTTKNPTDIHKIETPMKGAWVHAVAPNKHELDAIAESFKLDRSMLNDAVDIYEAPRIEVEHGDVYVFMRYCFPGGSEISTEPLLIVLTSNNIITVVRRDSGILDKLNSGTTTSTEQKSKFMIEILAAVNNSYRSELLNIGKKILQIRAQLKKTDLDNDVFISFIDLEEDLNEYLAALRPQKAMLENLENGKDVKFYEEDRDLLDDLRLSSAELIDLAAGRLSTISSTREAYATISANTLNKTFKRLTSISIFMTIPTITAGLYGMNLRLPLAKNPMAFWYILTIVMAITVVTVVYFQKKKWL